MKKAERIFWGLLLIAVGAIVALNSLGITHINIFFKGWWTLFIILPSIKGLFSKSDKTWSFIFLLIGVVLLLCAQGVIEGNLVGKLIFPAILIIMGLSIIFKDAIGENIYDKIKTINNSESQEYYATFSGQQLKFTGDEFKGANLNAVFGGIDLDLKEANIEKDQLINISAIFGGVDVLVPANVNVKVKSTSLFGGIDNKVKTYKEGAPTIYVKAFCLFGGADIK